MGSGKSVVGRALARLTGLFMVDADAELVRRAGRPISQIFQEDGEDAFRELERSVIRDLCSQSGKVIAAGGGSFVDPDNRNLMLAKGQVICLTARPETILRRVSQAQGNVNPNADSTEGKAPLRPLLAGDNPLLRIKELLAQLSDAERNRLGIDRALRGVEDVADLPDERIVNGIAAMESHLNRLTTVEKDNN